MKKRIILISIIIFLILLIIIAICISKNDKVENANIHNNENKEESNNANIFGEYYNIAYEKLATMTLDEKIGQLFLVRYPSGNEAEILKQYKFGGYLFFEKDFKGKTEEEIKEEIANLQNISNIPILTAIDEEGGKVVRASSNSNLREEKFKSASELYTLGGFDKIKEDTIQKSEFLYNLGVNLNLAPVVDVCTNPNDYMYERSFKQDANLTAKYAETVINASKNGKVSYVLKHFPGYGNNTDTHKGISVDNRTYEDIMQNDILPFVSGIEAGAEAILMSHNIVTSIDPNNPVSLSLHLHEILRKDLGFTGIIITDDLYMGAVSTDEEAVVKAILAKNNLIIVTDYEKSINDIKKAIQEGKINEDLIDKLAVEVLAWKCYKGMM